MALRLFLDSADPKAWQQWLASGLFHGVTTNPTLLRRAAQPCTLPIWIHLLHHTQAR